MGLPAESTSRYPNNNVIVFNLRAIPIAVRNMARRQKWRLRPFKKLVLPIRSIKRIGLESVGGLLGRIPPHLESSTLNYATVHSEISVREIHPPELVHLPPHPFGLTLTIHQEKSDPALVFEIPNVNFWAYNGGAVVTADNDLLADLSPEVWGSANHPIFSRWHLPKAELLNGRIAIGCTPEAAGNYYHWLLDLLPRILLLKHATQNFSGYDAILVNGSHANYEAETLAALGLPSEKIRYVHSGDRFQIASGVFPSLEMNVLPAPWKVRGLRELVSTDKASPGRYLYLSRARAAVRRIANEEQIIKILCEHDFEIVEAANLSFREQAGLFATADKIIAPHGAALANIVFCQPGTRLVEISTRSGYREWYWQLAAVAGLSYQVLETQPVGSPSQPAENADMILNRDHLVRLLARLQR